MSGARNSPTSPRFPGAKSDHHHSRYQPAYPYPHPQSAAAQLQQHTQSWDEATSTHYQHQSIQQQQQQQQQQHHGQAGVKPPTTRAASSPLPYKCPKSPRNFRVASTGGSYEPAPPRSPSIRSGYSGSGSYAEAVSPSRRYDNPPRSPKITTTYANDSCEDSESTPSYYQTPTSASASVSVSASDSTSCGFYSSHTPASPRHSPSSPRKFVFDAISPVAEQTSKKFEYYEPMSPDEVSRPGQALPPFSPHRSPHSNSNSSSNLTAKMLAKSRPDWELASGHLEERNLKRDSCVTESTQLSGESNETATTMVSSSGVGGDEPQMHALPDINRRRRHAINITSNPGYQVLHSSHSTLDRTCSDSVVSLRYRKSTSDLTRDGGETDLKASMSAKSPVDGGAATGNGNHPKPRRRGSSKGGLAYLASRRSSRESMKSACSNASIFSNDDIGPLAFQASNRGRQRRTSNFLELPVPDHIRPRVCSLPDRPYNPRASDDLYRLRHFSISKGNVVNCGDSIISRRSRSNTSVNSTNSRASERSPFEGSCCGGGYANVDSVPASPDDEDDSDNMEPPPPPRYRVVMLGDAGVGKTALVNQFMTSEYMHTYDASLDDEFGEKTVSVLLDDEESELVFIDHPSVEMSVENSLSTYEPHGCVVVFSVVDKGSFRVAEEIINYLWQERYTKDKAVILVGNKADLARSRLITVQDGKALAASRDTKFIETSSGIQHNVDELLVGILKQMRLKENREKKATASKMKTSRTHISLHLAKEILQKICLSDISKSKSCENLHVL